MMLSFYSFPFQTGNQLNFPIFCMTIKPPPLSLLLINNFHSSSSAFFFSVFNSIHRYLGDFSLKHIKQFCLYLFLMFKTQLLWESVRVGCIAATFITFSYFYACLYVYCLCIYKYNFIVCTPTHTHISLDVYLSI